MSNNMINFINMVNKHTLYYKVNILLFNRMKHTNIIYNAITKKTLIDNSLIKDLEIAKARKNKDKANIKIIEIKEVTSFEMSESHEVKPYIKN